MAHLQSYSYPGTGVFLRENLNYAQAIRVENRIMTSGQGGWSRDSPLMNIDLAAEVDQAFQNVEANLKDAGGKGWEQVYLVRTYSTDLKLTHDLLVAGWKKYMPNHYAVWTELQVPQLGVDAMHIEIEVEAHDPEGAKKAEEERGKEMNERK